MGKCPYCGRVVDDTKPQCLSCGAVLLPPSIENESAGELEQESLNSRVIGYALAALKIIWAMVVEVVEVLLGKPWWYKG